MNESKSTFSSCDRLSFCLLKPELLPKLEIINKRFTRRLKIALSSLTTNVIDVDFNCSKAMLFEQAFFPESNFYCAGIVNCEGLSGHLAISIDRNFSNFLIGTLLGDKNAPVIEQTVREVSDIDVVFLEVFIDAMVQSYNEAWDAFFEIKASKQRLETESQFITISAPSETILKSDFSVLYDDTKYKFSIVLPYFTFFPCRDILI